MDNNVFPLPFEFHVAFVCIALVLFVFRFIVSKRTYQLFMAVAAPLTLLLQIDDISKTLYYCIGMVELVLIAGSVISVFMDKKKKKADALENNSEEKVEA